MAKAGRPKKGSVRLPDWFDIEKYRTSKDWKAAEWHLQFTIRWKLLKYVEHLSAFSINVSVILQEALLLIREDPIFTIARIEAVPPRSLAFVELDMLGPDPALTSVLFGLGYNVAGVRDIDFGQALQIVLAITQKLNIPHLHRGHSHIVKVGGVYKSVESLARGSAWSLVKLLNAWDTPLANIDLTLPDKVLMKDFAAFLKEKRKQKGRVDSPFVKNPDFKSWYRSGVLAYLDLTLWEKATGESLRWGAFADALNKIVDVPIGSEGALIKTTKAHAKKLMNAQALKILGSQAIREEKGTTTKSGKLDNS